MGIIICIIVETVTNDCCIRVSLLYKGFMLWLLVSNSTPMKFTFCHQNCLWNPNMSACVYPFCTMYSAFKLMFLNSSELLCKEWLAELNGVEKGTGVENACPRRLCTPELMHSRFCHFLSLLQTMGQFIHNAKPWFCTMGTSFVYSALPLMYSFN